MFLELIATVTVGIGTGGIVVLINKATRGRLPRWLVPVAAGLSMIGFTLWSEYSWAGRTADGPITRGAHGSQGPNRVYSPVTSGGDLDSTTVTKPSGACRDDSESR